MDNSLEDVFVAIKKKFKQEIPKFIIEMLKISGFNSVLSLQNVDQKIP